MIEWAPVGGDDNELVFSTAPRYEDAVSAIAEASKTSIVKVRSAVMSKVKSGPRSGFRMKTEKQLALGKTDFAIFSLSGPCYPNAGV